MQHTPGGWPYLGLGDYVDETPDYSLELANKLQGIAPTAPGAVTDTGWKALQLLADRSGNAWYRVINGIVYLRGRVTRTTGPWGTSFLSTFTLPTEARPSSPSSDVTLYASATNRFGDVFVLAITGTSGLTQIRAATSANDIELSSIPPFPRA